MDDHARKSTPSEEADKHPLDRDVRSPGAWMYLGCYLLIGASGVMILVEVIQSGLWVKLGTPCLLIWFGMFGLMVARRNERMQLRKHSEE